MPFEQYPPSGGTKRFIENYWIIRSGDSDEKVEKIIPDGFTEIIFHYGDPYCIKWKDSWAIQPMQLLAGQIRKYFFLKNTGKSGVIGIKFKPAALTALFGLDMSQFTDKVVDLHSVLGDRLAEVGRIACSDRPGATRIGLIDEWLSPLFSSRMDADEDRGITAAVDLIFGTNGLISVAELSSKLFITERQIERLFRKFIGLPPKFYARIVRFNYIFSLIQDKKLTWTELAAHSGYYDLSHFARNFQSFTGEDPSSYVFEDTSLANFFLLKKPRS